MMTAYGFKANRIVYKLSFVHNLSSQDMDRINKSVYNDILVFFNHDLVQSH